MRPVLLLTMVVGLLVFVATSGAAGGAGTLTPSAFSPGQSNVALTANIPDCAGDGVPNQGVILQEDSGSAALDDVFYPNPPALNAPGTGGAVFTGSGDVNPKAALGTHTLIAHCNGSDHAITVTVGSTATPVPTATPGGLPDFGSNPGNPVSISPTTFPLDKDNVPATVTAAGCTTYDLHLVDRVQEAANDEEASGSAFNYLPTLLDSGQDGTAPDGDGVYPGGFNVNGTGQTPGVHTLDVICGTKAFGTLTITLSSGATSKGPHNKAPKSPVQGASALIAWTYDSSNPFHEKSDSSDFKVKWPTCADKGGTSVLFPASVVYNSAATGAPVFKHAGGSKYEGAIYVGASAKPGNLDIPKVRCVKNGKVVSYGTVHLGLTRKSVNVVQKGALPIGEATSVTLSIPRCRDPKVSAVSFNNALFSPNPVSFARASPTTFTGTEQTDPDIGVGGGQGTVSCGSGKIGFATVTATAAR